MSRLYIDTYGEQGNKPDIVMLHGWAMHGGLMTSLAKQLATRYRVHVVDLPGHGNSESRGEAFMLAEVANALWQEISKLVTSEPVVIGWSLGGMVATQLVVDHADKIAGLVLIASNPSFIKRDDWSLAVEKDILHEFARQLEQDREATLTRFLALQVRGSGDSRQVLKQLREQLFARPMANVDVLKMGLDILEQEDLRSRFQQIELPVLLLAGERDTLVPVTAVQELASSKTNVTANIIKKAGHAPFLSHEAETVVAITEFLS